MITFKGKTPKIMGSITSTTVSMWLSVTGKGYLYDIFTDASGPNVRIVIDGIQFPSSSEVFQFRQYMDSVCMLRFENSLKIYCDTSDIGCSYSLD